MAYLGKTLLEYLFGLERDVDALCERTACREGHLHGKVALVESGDKLCSESGEQPQRCGKHGKRSDHGLPYVAHTRTQHGVIALGEPLEKSVSQRGAGINLPLQEKRSHHRDVCQRQDQRAYDAEDESLRHRGEILALDARKRQYGEEYYQDNEHGKGGALDYARGSLLDLSLHLVGRQGTPCKSARTDMRHDALQYDDGAVYHNAKVDGTEAHQIGRHTECPHQYETEEHGQGYDRRHDEAGTHIAQEDDEHHEDYQRTLQEVDYDGRYVALDELGAVEVRLDSDALWQHTLHFLYPLFEHLSHHIGVGPLEHHGYAADAFALAVHRHCTKTLGRTKGHPTDVADVHWHTATIGDDNLLDVLSARNHTLRAYVVGLAALFDIAAASVLVVLFERIKNIGDSQVQGWEHIGVYGNLILLHIAAETVYLHNTGYARELAFHNPVLYGAQFHGIILVLVGIVHPQYVLVYLSQPRRDRHKFRSAELRRYLASHGLNLFVDELACLKGRYVLLEDHRHERQPEARHGANLHDVHDVAHGNLDRHGYELLHLLRSQCRRHGHNLYLIVGNVRNCINGQSQHRIYAAQQKKQSRQCYEQLLLDRKSYY